jgi:hypothetical protein
VLTDLPHRLLLMMTVCTTSPPDAGPIAGRSHAGSRLLAEPGQMTLRVHGPGGQERMAQIRSPKCTVGSAAGCTLRICAPGVGPLHCWILRGPAGTLVRRLHGRATLNGSTFDEVPLKVGDRLRIGSVELETIECNQPPPIQSPLFSPPQASPAISDAELGALKAELAEAREKVTRLESESRQGFQSSITAAERADQLSDALNAAHSQLEEAARELAAVQETVNRQNEQLNAYQAQADELRVGTATTVTELASVREQLAAAGRERAWLEAEVEQARQVLANEKAHWEEEKSRWQEERSSVQNEHTQLQRRLTQRDAEIASLRSCGGQTNPMTVVLDELSGENSRTAVPGELEAKCQELQSQIAAQQTELETLRRMVGEHTIIEGRFEKLTRDYDLRCIELDEARAQVTAAAAAGSRASDDAEERAAALTRWQEDLASREQRLADEQQRLAGEQQTRQAHHEQLTADRQQLDALRAEIAEQQAGLEHQRAVLAAEQQQFAGQREQLLAAAASSQFNDRELQIGQQDEELKQQIAAANSRLADVEQLRQELSAERAALEERALCLEDRHNELDSRSRQLDSRMQELQSLRDEVDRQIAEFTQRQELAHCNQAAGANRSVAPPPAAEPKTREAPAQPVSEAGVNVTAPWQPPESLLNETDSAESDQPEEVLARLVKSGIWRGESSEGHSEEPLTTAKSPVTNQAPAAGGKTAGDEEESIELYMERLLKRVRGETSVRLPAPPPEADAEFKPQLADEAAEEIQDPAAEKVDENSLRRTAPKLNENLSAMRDLANTAARSAIDRHVRKHKGKQAAGTIFIALLTLGFSGVASYRAWQLHSLEAGVAAGIGGAAGAYWLLASLRRLLSLMRLRQPHGDKAASHGE